MSSARRSPSSTTTNSSPPKRPAVCNGGSARATASPPRTVPFRRLAIRRSSSSPAAVPSVSLTRPKRSQLTNSTANSPPASAGALRKAWVMCSTMTARFGSAVSASVRVRSRCCDAMRCCSCCTACVTSLRLAISDWSSSFSKLIASVCGGAPHGPVGPSGMRSDSKITPPTEPCAAAWARSPGATPASTSNRFTRLPSVTSGISNCADIGLIIVISPSAVACSRPISAWYRNCTRAS